MGKKLQIANAMLALAASSVALQGWAAPLGTPGVAANAAEQSTTGDGTAHPEIWPKYDYPVPVNQQDETRITDLLKRMTLEEKIGQLVQGDICCLTPADVKKYHLGSVLAGGNSGPGGNDFAPAPEWLKLADQFWDASIDKSGGVAGIPVIWGIDAVHGHANVIGATVFPHNIGLGAAHDPELIERIGAATAVEVAVTGQDWTFAPTVTVPQDFRWGRAYEGYSSDPALVSSYVGAMVRGLQGPVGQRDMLGHGKVLASTKHFLADGGTFEGVDQGNARISETALRDIHGAPYGQAMDGGVATVMASFSSWQGRKMTGNGSLLTGVLRGRMNFGGFVVSDWNAHGQVEGCTVSACPQALLAGVDMYMAPDSWKPIWENLLSETKAGHIPMARVDEAVARILRVKMRMGLFEAGKPSSRMYGGHWDMLGSPQHRMIAREAVRKSLVLLKNQGVLPIRPNARVLVAGDGGDDVARAAGGWTITWQGSGLNNGMFPGSTTLWKGISDEITSAGGSTELSPDGRFKKRPDVAVVVFGEKPYAEFQGDRKSLQLDPELTKPFETMRRLKAQGIPVVAVMLTGRPLFVNAALNIADAFVVAWLPGTEGAGLADVIIGDAAGKPRFDFTGRLPAPWPRSADMKDGSLWPFGSGLNYNSPKSAWARLSVDPGVANAGDARLLFSAGQPAGDRTLNLRAADGASLTRITTVPSSALGGRVSVTAANTTLQEGARRFTLRSGGAVVSINAPGSTNFSREANGDVLLLITARVWTKPVAASVSMGCGGTACRGQSGLILPVTAGYVRYGIPLRCLASKGADMARIVEPFALAVRGPADLAISEVRLGTDAQQILPCK